MNLFCLIYAYLNLALNQIPNSTTTLTCKLILVNFQCNSSVPLVRF